MEHRVRTSRSPRTLGEAALRLRQLEREVGRLLSTFPELRRGDSRQVLRRSVGSVAGDRPSRTKSPLRAGRLGA